MKATVNKRIRCLTAGLLALSFSMAGSAALAAVTIDDFTTAQSFLQIIPGVYTSGAISVMGGGIAGGTRTTTVAGTVGGGGNVLYSASLGSAAVSTLNATATTTFLYNGAGLGAALAGQDDITISFLSLGTGLGPTLTVVVTVDGGAPMIQMPGSSGVPFNLVFDFPAAATTSVQIQFIGASDADFFLDGITAMGMAPPLPVPEPASIFAWGLFGMLILLRRRIGFA